jgi:DNA-binding CsgD family transcriptional regulator
VRSNGHQFDENLLMSIKCRTKHLKGFWKYLIFFSHNYWNENYKCLNKIGLILDERVDQQYQILDSGNGQTVINDVSTPTVNKKNLFENHQDRICVSIRETEILRLIGQGLVAKEIAAQLQISTSTVITHRKNLIQKLKVKNTAELIKKASQLLLI